MKIRYPKFGSSTSITLGPSQVTYRTRVPQGDRLVKVFLNDPTKPRVQAWTESYHEGITVSPLSLPLSDVFGVIFDSLRRLGKEVPENLRSFDLSLVARGNVTSTNPSPNPILGNGGSSSSISVALEATKKEGYNANGSSQDAGQVQAPEGRSA